MRTPGAHSGECSARPQREGTETRGGGAGRAPSGRPRLAPPPLLRPGTLGQPTPLESSRCT